MNTNDVPKAHPSLLDALRRQDEKAQQMNLSEGFEERVMSSLPKNRSPRLRLSRIAAIFLLAAFLGGLVWAISPIIRQKEKAPQSAKVSAPSLTGRAGGESFSNQRIDSILAVVAAHYDRAVYFRDTALQALRLSTVWDSKDSLSVFLETLNEFDGLRLTDERDTLFVESIGEEEE